MMKVALQFSGQQRSVDAGYEYYKKNLLDDDRYSVDVYAVTWNQGGPRPTKFPYKLKQLMYCKPFDAQCINDRYPNVINPQYPAFNTYSMFYSMFQANMLRKGVENREGIKYDVVIRTRFDYALNRKFDFDRIFSAFGDTSIFVPDDRMNSEHTFCSDMFAFGTPKVMDKYHNTFVNIDTLYDIGIPMNGEEMLAANLNVYGLTGGKMTYIDMNNPFPPGKYNFNSHAIIRDDFTQFNTNRG